jgi:regulator of sirC expression with transglutaminase-like and TPR domain
MPPLEENNELQALISLLDDPSDLIFDQIRDKLLFYGIRAIPTLEHAWDNSFDSLIQSRIEEIIHNIQLNQLRSDVSNWKMENQFDLLRGFFLAAKYQYPELDEKAINDKIEIIKRDIWLELNNNLTALEKVKVINHIVFEIHGFKGNKVNIDAPQNLFVNNLLDTRKGNHLSIGILYIILAQKLGIPIFGVDLPQHFILAYVDEIHDEKFTLANENELFIKHIKLKQQPSYFKPCDNNTIILRLFKNLKLAFDKQGYGEKVQEIQSIADVLK